MSWTWVIYDTKDPANNLCKWKNAVWVAHSNKFEEIHDIVMNQLNVQSTIVRSTQISMEVYLLL